MSNTTAGLIALIAVLVFLLLFIIIWIAAGLNSGSPLQRAREGYRAFRRSRDWGEKLAALFFYSPFYAKIGLGSIIIALGTAGFGCVVALFGQDYKIWQFIRDLLLKFSELFMPENQKPSSKLGTL